MLAMKVPTPKPTTQAVTLRRLVMQLRSDARGAALVEAAFALPIVIVLMMAVVSYSYWMLISQSLQQVANDAARASLAGLSRTEREALARTSVSSSIVQSTGLAAEKVATAVSEDAGYFRIVVSYDGSDNAILTGTIVPLPSTTISRDAAIAVPMI